MKNIAIIISSMGGGGTQQYILSLVNYLVNKKIKVFIYLTDYIDNTVVVKNAQIINLTNNKKGFKRNLQLILSIRNQLKLDNIDKVISFLPKVNCVSIIANFGLLSKLTVCERNDLIKQKIPFIWSFLRYLLYYFAENITVNSLFGLSLLKKIYPFKKNIFFTYNYIRGDIQKNLKINNNNFQDDFKYKIIGIGRLDPQKNFQELIYAFSKVKEKNSSLYILGNGPEKVFLEQLIKKLDLTERVFLISFRKNLYDWFNKADIHVMTSLFEGSPNVLWEASFLSIPSIVSSNVKSAFELLKPNEEVLKYRAGDIDELAFKIDYLLKNKSFLKKVSLKAKKSVDFLSVDSIFDIWIKILNLEKTVS